MAREKLPFTISFVAAASNSGKTTLIEKIVPMLKSRGLRVAVIKHAPGGFSLDHQGKDSWRFRQAGADTVILVGPGNIAIMKQTGGEATSADLERMTTDVDIAILEGFKQKSNNRIEVYRHGVSGTRPLCLDDQYFLALVSDKPFDVNVPRFDLNDAAGVAQFICNRVQDNDT